MFQVNWQEMLIPSTSVAEVFVRGTVIYLVLFVTMRLLPRRTIGSMGASDLLVVVLIADAVQNGMSNEYKSITEALVLAFTVFGWSLLIDWVDTRFPQWHLAGGEPLALIVDGVLQQRAMRRQQITEDEVMSMLREHGLESPRKVHRAYLEGDGRISVLTHLDRPQVPPRDDRGHG